LSALVITAANEEDLDAIDAIEQHSFKSPWSREMFKAELLREWERVDVGRLGGKLVAFCNYWLVTPRDVKPRDLDDERAAWGGEVHILAIATHPDYRGRGLARQILDHVLGVAVAAGCSLATLEVRRSNQPAIALYERAGFKTVHVRARYYQDDDEDALVMVKALPTSGDARSSLT
jgi:[ribosomal protein S18]-alanine N-acetyltransferase